VHYFDDFSLLDLELWAGAKTEQQIHAVDTLLSALIILPLEAASAKRSARIRRELVRVGLLARGLVTLPNASAHF
jgi:predicted nucleic acid-binding protein